MVLTDYLTTRHIWTGFQANGKAEALAALCRRAAGLAGLEEEAVLKVVLDREALGSTGVGGGVALPHGKSALVDRPVLVLAISPGGVDFDSLDGRPVHIFALLVTPLGGDGREHLSLLARLGGLFKSPSAVAEAVAARTPTDVFDFLARRGE